MPIFELAQDEFRPIPETSFEAAGIREREDLQRLFRSQIEIVAPDVLVVCEEFREWENSRCRIDLLAIDSDADLVVIELKRTQDGGHMELQALRYASMVADLTFEKVVEVYEAHLKRMGSTEVNGRERILDFLDWPAPDEDKFAQDVRIILVSAEFSPELTTSVLWLNSRGLDIKCVRVQPYADNGRVLVNVQQAIPLPEAADLSIRIKEKQVLEQSARREQSNLSQLCVRFWTELLERTRTASSLPSDITPSTQQHIAWATRKGASFAYAFGRTGARVELYIYGLKRLDSKTIFDRLFAMKPEIESRFGDALGWERLEKKQSCRIRFDLGAGSLHDEANWSQLQLKMIATMDRLVHAMLPSLDRLDT